MGLTYPNWPQLLKCYAKHAVMLMTMCGIADLAKPAITNNCLLPMRVPVVIRLHLLAQISKIDGLVGTRPLGAFIRSTA